MRNTFYTVLFILLFAVASRCAYGDNNSFFGANPSGGSPGSAGNSDSSLNSSSGTGNNQDYSKELPDDNNTNAVLPGLNETTPSKPNNMSDFTGDEKRMRKKYKDNLANAQQVMLKGTKMMKDAGDNVNNPSYKKGKILKEIGEKSLADLKANNPFPDQKTK